MTHVNYEAFHKESINPEHKWSCMMQLISQSVVWLDTSAAQVQISLTSQEKTILVKINDQIVPAVVCIHLHGCGGFAGYFPPNAENRTG